MSVEFGESNAATRRARKNFLPGVEDVNRVGRRLDWTPADAESATFESMGEEAEVEKSALVRFALFTALRDRRVTPREVSIVVTAMATTTTKTRSRSGKRCGYALAKRNAG